MAITYSADAYERAISNPNNNEGDPFLRLRMIQLIKDLAEYQINVWDGTPEQKETNAKLRWAIKVRDKINGQGAIDAFYGLVDLVTADASFTGKTISDAALKTLIDYKIVEVMKGQA